MYDTIVVHPLRRHQSRLIALLQVDIPADGFSSGDTLHAEVKRGGLIFTATR